MQAITPGDQVPSQNMSMTDEELTSSLHRVGRIYWHRPDTADCLVTVTRLCSTQHKRLCPPQQQHQCLCHQNPCLCNGTDRIVERQLCQSASTAPSTPLLPTFSSHPTCASTLPENRSSAHRTHGQVSPVSTTTPTHPSSLGGGKDLGSNSSNLDQDGLDASCGSALQIAHRFIYRSTIGQASRHRSSGSVVSLSTVSEDLASVASHPKRIEAGHVASSSRSRLLVSGDIRRESAPPNMYMHAARICSHVEDEQNQRSTTYRLHRDFLISQSQVFKTLLQPGRGQTASASLAATMAIKEDVSTTSVEIALPDPSSFAVLVEYFYMGNFDRLTAAMESGKVRWENVMLNASHLGLSAGLKRQLGGWWRERRDGLHSVQRGAYHRSSMPVLTSDMNGGSGGGGELGSWYGESSSQSGSGGGRCRAYTTGSRDQVEYKARRVALTPSKALALASGLVRPATEQGISSGNKRLRTTEPDTESSHRLSLQCHSGSQQHANTARTVVESPRSSSTWSHLHRTRKSMLASWPLETRKSPVEEQLQRDEGRSDDGRAVSGHERAERPSAVRQLLLGGGKRRRALSSLAYYCTTTRTQGSNISAPVKQ